MAEPIDFSDPRYSVGVTPQETAARRKEAASAASSEAGTARTVTLLPSEKREKDAQAAVAEHNARTLGFGEADKEFQKQLVAWRSGDAASFFERMRELRNAIKLLKSGKQITGPLYGKLPDTIKALVSPESVDIRGDVEKVIQQSLRETLGGQFTQQEGSALLARTYNPELPESFVAGNVEAELNKIIQIAKAREAMSRYYEENGTLKGYNPKQWLPAVEKDFNVSQGMSADDKREAAANAMLDAQRQIGGEGQISGEGIKGIRFRPNEEAALLDYVNSDKFTPVGYANMLSEMYAAVSATPPPRSVLLDQGRELAAAPVGARAGGLSYEKIDEEAMRNAGFTDSAIQALKNMPESAANFGMALVSPLTDAVKSLAQGERAGVYQTVPDLVGDLAAKVGIGDADGETLSALSDALTERYGGVDALKTTLIKDPVGFAGDLSVILSGGGTLLGRGAGKIGALGAKAAAAGQAIDPLAFGVRLLEKTAPVVKPAAEFGGKLATEGLAFTSGAPPSAIREAAATGFERQQQGPTARSEAFRAGLTGEADIPATVEMARNALASLRDEASQQYRSGMVDISKDKTVLAFSDLDNALSNLRTTGRYKGQTIRKGGAGVLDEMEAAINDWRSLDPVEYHTPEGFDALKQQLGDIRDRIPADDRVSMRIATNLYNAAKRTIRKQAPVYEKVMGQYKGAMDEAKRIEQELGLRGTSAIDTAMLKLTQRPPQRRGREDLTSLLTKYEPELGATIAGEQLSPLLPRGIRGATMAASSIPAGYFLSPAAAVYGATTSPRMAGELAYGAGRVGGAAMDLGSLVKKYPTQALAAQRGLSLAQMTEEEQARDLAERYGLTLPVPEGIDEYTGGY